MLKTWEFKVAQDGCGLLDAKHGSWPCNSHRLNVLSHDITAPPNSVKFYVPMYMPASLPLGIIGIGHVYKMKWLVTESLSDVIPQN